MLLTFYRRTRAGHACTTLHVTLALPHLTLRYLQLALTLLSPYRPSRYPQVMSEYSEYESYTGLYHEIAVVARMIVSNRVFESAVLLVIFVVCTCSGLATDNPTLLSPDTLATVNSIAIGVLAVKPLLAFCKLK